MNGIFRISSIGLAIVLGLALVAPRPALANGAASTRNIIFGAAAAAAGTLIILNHNKKVHQKYAEYDRRQAQTQSEANQAEAAYQSERGAYDHEAALVSEYRQETAYQHDQVVVRDREIASLKHSLIVAKYGSPGRTVAFAPTYRGTAARSRARSAAPVRRDQLARATAPAPALVSYGWGNY